VSLVRSLRAPGPLAHRRGLREARGPQPLLRAAELCRPLRGGAGAPRRFPDRALTRVTAETLPSHGNLASFFDR